MKWNSNNKKYYESKGYQFTKMNNEFNINIEDLPNGSNILVQCQCDYCYEIVFKKIGKIRLSTEIINKICCKKCAYQKTKESILKKYGVENVYQSERIKQKIKQTCLIKYGVDNVSKSKIIKEKIQQTFLKKYGVTTSWKDKNVRNKIVKSTIKTFYKNQSGICSKQQRYLYNLLGGKLNYPVDLCQLDIAFPNEMIYIEYDGSGHDLCMKFGCSEKEFKRKQFQRKIFLQNQGWKLIRIISTKDLLPNDEVILNLINNYKQYLLNQNHTWVEIDIDNLEIRSSKTILKFDFSELRKIK